MWGLPPYILSPASVRARMSHITASRCGSQCPLPPVEGVDVGMLTHMAPYIVLVSGVAGSGKSTLADPPVERVGLVGPGFYIRITPRKSWR